MVKEAYWRICEPTHGYSTPTINHTHSSFQPHMCPLRPHDLDSKQSLWGQILDWEFVSITAVSSLLITTHLKDEPTYFSSASSSSGRWSWQTFIQTLGDRQVDVCSGAKYWRGGGGGGHVLRVKSLFTRASSRHFAWLGQSVAGGRHAFASKASLEGA